MDRSDLLTWQGLAALADAVMPVTADNTVLFPTNLTRGSVLFTSKAWRAPWRASWLPRVTQPTVLVTAFHDRAIRAHPLAEMLASPIRHWFGVQCAAKHPRLTAMPIGIDGRRLAYVQAAERCTTRDVALYCNFALANRWPHSLQERHAVWQAFASQPWVTAEQRVSPAHHAAMLGRSRFVLSPPGNGWDCYRTYEAMAMGAIPIVRRQRPTSDVCESLPVLIVDDWREVTPDRLQREWDMRQPKDTRTLTLTYWRDRIDTVSRATRGRGSEEHTWKNQ